MGFRLLLLMAMGLGAMYMMHLLAQDYNKIRQPINTATRLLTSASTNLMRAKRSVKPYRIQVPEVKDPSRIQDQLSVDWKRILSRDPFECLQSLICQIMSGAEGSSKEATLLMDFLEGSLAIAPSKIGQAFSRGLALRGSTQRCYDEYPFCIYSARTMLRMLRWFTNDNVEEGTV